MDCRAVRERLHDYLSQELGRAEAEAVDGHLESCADCCRLVQRWQQFRAAIRRAGRQLEVPGGFAAKLATRLREAHARPAAPAWLPDLRLAPALAVLLVLLAIVPFALRSLQPAPQGTPVAEVIHPVTRVDGMLAAMVADHNMHGNALEPPDSEAAQRRVMEQYRKVLDASPRIPAALDHGYRRGRCFLCPVGSGHIPHIQYRLGARTVSLFLAPTKGVTIDGRPVSTIAERSLLSARYEGENLLAWRSGAAVYVLVSRESPDTLMNVATELFGRG